MGADLWNEELPWKDSNTWLMDKGKCRSIKTDTGTQTHRLETGLRYQQVWGSPENQTDTQTYSVTHSQTYRWGRAAHDLVYARV